jgi:hypothetical protein
MISRSRTKLSTQKLFAFALIVLMIVVSMIGPMLTDIKSVQAANAVITYWTFNSVPPDASLSTGTLAPASGNGSLRVSLAVPLLKPMIQVMM